VVAAIVKEFQDVGQKEEDEVVISLDYKSKKERTFIQSDTGNKITQGRAEKALASDKAIPVEEDEEEGAGEEKEEGKKVIMEEVYPINRLDVDFQFKLNGFQVVIIRKVVASETLVIGDKEAGTTDQRNQTVAIFSICSIFTHAVVRPYDQSVVVSVESIQLIDGVRVSQLENKEKLTPFVAAVYNYNNIITSLISDCPSSAERQCWAMGGDLKALGAEAPADL
jgi:hypothetical protein